MLQKDTQRPENLAKTVYRFSSIVQLTEEQTLISYSSDP
jgi:hypothetical protein